MESIIIKNISCWDTEFENKKGIEIAYFRTNKKAKICDLSKNKRTKSIPKKDFESFWKKFNEINYQKVFIENESHQGFDGSDSIIILSAGLQELKLSLWSPNKEFYEENNLTESIKLLEVVYELIDYAAKHHVAVGFEF